jgi:uncharacterized integral membrane protein
MTTTPVGKPGDKRAGAHQQNRLVTFLKGRWLPLLIVILVCIFIGTNAQKVTVHLFGAHFQARLWLMLLITAGLGFLAGWLFQNRRQHLKSSAKQ